MFNVIIHRKVLNWVPSMQRAPWGARAQCNLMNQYIFSSQLRADQMPGPPLEGQLTHELSLDWQHYVYCSTKQSILMLLSLLVSRCWCETKECKTGAGIMIVHAECVHEMQSGKMGPSSYNPSCIGTIRNPPERSSRLKHHKKSIVSCRCIQPSCHQSALSNGCPHHLSGH